AGAGAQAGESHRRLLQPAAGRTLVERRCHALPVGCTPVQDPQQGAAAGAGTCLSAGRGTAGAGGRHPGLRVQFGGRCGPAFAVSAQPPEGATGSRPARVPLPVADHCAPRHHRRAKAARGTPADSPGAASTRRVAAQAARQSGESGRRQPARGGAAVGTRRAHHRVPPDNALSMNTPVRKIVHIDMDAFYASVEQRDDRRLQNRPVVVAWRGARSVVCAASYEARRFGIHSAMPALRAERLCPHAIFVPPDFARYKAVSRQIHTIFARHTDLIEPLSLDEAYLDVTAADAPSATAVAGAIRAAIRAETGLTASAGIAPNKFLAKIASDWRKPDGQFVISPRRVDAFLTPLPVGKIPGVGKVMRGKLH